jgi:hypothetical protein
MNGALFGRKTLKCLINKGKMKGDKIILERKARDNYVSSTKDLYS